MRNILSAALALAMTLSLLPAALAAPASGTAYASTQSVEVDGKAVTFQAYALKDASGNDTNYVKLRDVAHILNGTSAQFSVGWDGAINIIPGQPYTDTGSEMTTPYSGDRSYTVSSAETRINGAAASLDAIELKDDNGGAYTYYKLRDLGTALGFTVDWSAQRGIFIETGGTAQPSTPTQPANPLDLFQGAWKRSFQNSNGGTTFEEIIITGNQLELLQRIVPSNTPTYFKGTVLVQENMVNSGDGQIYPYVLTWTLKERMNNTTKEMKPYDATVYCYFSSIDLNAGEMKTSDDSVYTRMNTSDSSTMYAVMQAELAELEVKKENLSKYPNYEERPNVPDLGAIYGIEADKVSINNLFGSDIVTYYYITTGNSQTLFLKGWAQKELDPKEWAQKNGYSYESIDDILNNNFAKGMYRREAESLLKERYTELLKECGFEETEAKSNGGVWRTYYVGYGYSIYIDTLTGFSVSVSKR